MTPLRWRSGTTRALKLPDLGSPDMQDYVWQMCVYAELYRVRSGHYPARAILYFLNELDQEPAPVTDRFEPSTKSSSPPR